MVQVKFNKPIGKDFNNLFEDFFNNFPATIADEATSLLRKNSVPVNIKETLTAYKLEVIAPGFEKADFKVNLENNLLTVSAERKAETKEENEKQVRKEFSYSSFKRSFTIDEKIDAAAIEAAYNNGVLQLNLPKKAEVNTSAKEIIIN
jgi:HSP20 family protein